MVGCHAMYLYHMPYSRGRNGRVHLRFLARYVTVIYNAHVDTISVHDVKPPSGSRPVSSRCPNLPQTRIERHSFA